MKTILFSKSFAASALGMMLTFGSAAGLYSCSDDEFLAKVNIPEEKTLTTGLEAKEQVLEFDIESDSEWSIDFDKTGNHIAYVYPRSGKGNAKVKLHVLPNFDDVARSGNMHINFAKNPSQNKDIAIVQKAKTDGEDNYNPDLLGEQSYGLGWGYDTSLGTSAVKCLKYPVIMSEYLKKEGYVGPTADNEFKIRDQSYTGSTIAELKSDFEAHAEFEGGGFGFNAELNATFNMNDFSNEQYEYAMSYVDITSERNMITKNPIALRMEDAMVPEAYEMLNDAEAYPNGEDTYYDIVRYFGTHVVIKASLGGRLNFATKVNTSKVTKEYDLDAFAKLSYSGIVETSASVKETYKQTWEENKKACETTVTALGGSTEFKHKIVTSSSEELKDNVKEWIADITSNGTGSFISIADKSDLLPIWEFVKNAQRRKELKEYIESGKYKSAPEVTYDLGVQGHLSDVGSLIADMNSNDYKGSLIKSISLGDNGEKTIALLCSEYIPEINKKGRVAVFYPVINGIVKYNMGLFLGNNYSKPARVSNYNGKMTIIPDDKKEVGEYKDIYFRGSNINLEEVDDETPVLKASIEDYTAMMLKGWPHPESYKYPLVKVQDNLWLRENYAAEASEYSLFSHFRNDKGDLLFDNDCNRLMINNAAEWKLPTEKNIQDLFSLFKRYNQNFAEAALSGGFLGTDFILAGYYSYYSWMDDGFRENYGVKEAGNVASILLSASESNARTLPVLMINNQEKTFYILNSYTKDKKNFNGTASSIRFVKPIE